MAKNSLSRQISDVIRSYKRGASKLSNVIGLSLKFAQENDGNPVHLQKIMDGVDPQDAALVSGIINAAGGHTVKEGMVKVRKLKSRVWNDTLIDRLCADKAPSFRTIAGELGLKKPADEKPFDLDAAAKNFLKRVTKEGVDLQAVSEALSRVAAELSKQAKEAA